MKVFHLRQLHFKIAQYHTAVKFESRGRGSRFLIWIAEFENTYYPREQCYDRLIEVTGCLGISVSSLLELSHLSVSDGMTASQSIIEILRENGVLE